MEEVERTRRWPAALSLNPETGRHANSRFHRDLRHKVWLVPCAGAVFKDPRKRVYLSVGICQKVMIIINRSAFSLPVKRCQVFDESSFTRGRFLILTPVKIVSLIFASITWNQNYASHHDNVQAITSLLCSSSTYCSNHNRTCCCLCVSSQSNHRL